MPSTGTCGLSDVEIDRPNPGRDFVFAGKPDSALVRCFVPWAAKSFAWAGARLVRYADDMVILAREWSGGTDRLWESRLEGKFGTGD